MPTSTSTSTSTCDRRRKRARTGGGANRHGGDVRGDEASIQNRSRNDNGNGNGNGRSRRKKAPVTTSIASQSASTSNGSISIPQSRTVAAHPKYGDGNDDYEFSFRQNRTAKTKIINNHRAGGSYRDRKPLRMLAAKNIAFNLMQREYSGRVNRNGRQRRSAIAARRDMFIVTKTTSKPKAANRPADRNMQNIHPSNGGNSSSSRNASQACSMLQRQWKKCMLRQIPFTMLGTPMGDAVLAMDRSASYLVCLGGKSNRDNPDLALAINFYALPSPSQSQQRLQHQQNQQQHEQVDLNRMSAGDRLSLSPPSSPSCNRNNASVDANLIRTIPLFRNSDLEDNTDSYVSSMDDFERRSISPTTTPVRMLFSSDWRIGIALLIPKATWNDSAPPGTILLFSTPHHTTSKTLSQDSNDALSSTWACRNVKIACKNAFTLRNMLWKVSIMPDATFGTNKFASPSERFACDTVLSVPGYLFLNDEADGFRMTWVADEWNLDELGCRQNLADLDGRSKGDTFRDFEPFDSPVITRDETWEEYVTTNLSGKYEYDAASKLSILGLNIVCEAFLHIDDLLNVIVMKRKNLSERHPEFQYNLISTSAGGRVLDLVITFLCARRNRSLGVFVSVDIIGGAYKEHDWIQRPGRCGGEDQRDWCNRLALNRRMLHTRVGPCSVESHNRTKNWGQLCQETNFDMDAEDDLDPQLWKPCVAGKGKPPKKISMSTVYPDCDVVTNETVISSIPVCCLACRDAPVRLMYDRTVL